MARGHPCRPHRTVHPRRRSRREEVVGPPCQHHAGPGSVGSVAVIRISGSAAVEVAANVFRPGGRFKFDWRPRSHRVHYGTVVDDEENVLDEVRVHSALVRMCRPPPSSPGTVV